MSKKNKNLKLKAPPSLLNIHKSSSDLNNNQAYFASQFTGKSHLSFDKLKMLKTSALYFDTETGICSGIDDSLIKAKQNADAEKKQIMEAINVECASKVNAEKKKKRL